jgi:hypothetical protein
MSRCQRECHRFEPDILLQTMKKILLVPLLLYNIAYACQGYVIGFKGLHGIFDTNAFYEYHNNLSYCGISYNWYESKKAIEVIKVLEVPYQLYAFSKGAETVVNILNSPSAIKNPPEYIITIGAYRTTNVNFAKYGIRFDNYFDHSSQGQKSPGIFLNVPHFKMQSEVNNRGVRIVVIP